MPKPNNKIIFSLPSELTREIEKLIKKERKTKNEILREALRKYVEDKRWKEILEYGRMKAKERGIRKKDVDRIIHEYRAERRKT